MDVKPLIQRPPQALLTGLLAAFLCAPTHAQLPLTRLTTIFPTGGKAGTTVEVEVTGNDFEELSALTFSHPGLTAKPKEGAANRFVITIAGDTPADLHEAWLTGRFGSSNPRIFVVGTQDERTDPGGINSLDKAAELPLNTPFHGRADGNLADYFKLTLKQGQRIVLDCQAEELDSRMQPSLGVFDALGRELARNRLGGIVDFTAPTDGVFFVQVHDFLFRGGHEHFYRLTASTAPHLDFVLPPSGPAGDKAKFTLFGRNLPGGKPSAFKGADGRPLEQLEVEIQLPANRHTPGWFSAVPRAAGAAVDGFEHRLPSPQGPSNPVFISFATGPVVVEQEPNHELAKAGNVTLPVEFTGQFFPANDRDAVRFDAKKGEAWWIEVFAHRLGQQCNPFLLIQRIIKNDKGGESTTDLREVYDPDANVGGRVFNTDDRDPVVRFEVPEDGSYRVLVRDLFNQSSRDNPALVYRLSIRRDTPDFRLVAMPDSPPPKQGDQFYIHVTPAAIRRGESLPVDVYALRRDGFNGEINLTVEGLPAGLRAGAAKIEAGRNSAQIIFTAEENAAAWTGQLKITGKAKIGEAEVARQAGAAALRWDVGNWNEQPVLSRLAGGVALSVIGAEAAPVSFAPSENKLWEAQENAKLAIPLKITRRAEFNANLKLKALGLAALDKLAELDVDGKATNATLTIDLTQHKLPVGTHTFYLRAQTAGKYRNNPEAAATADADLKAAEKIAGDAAAAAKAAADALTTAVKAAAEKASTEAAAKAKDTEAKKAAAAERAKAANEKAKPRDVTIMAYSPTITVVVSPAPPPPAPEKK